ncbi:MAG: leucine-rich repeat protein [Bacteroidaceae bacterium]|nr:leucine-rich repeat protein [Bacteroidaceae bacterium]
MTKRKITYAVLALLTLGFTACQQEEDFAPQGGNDEIRISFTSDAIQTRVNTLGTGDKWENGDQILVFNTSNSMNATFTASVVDESASWTQDKKLFWDGDGNNTLLAAYPAGSEYGSFTLPTDQSDETKLKSADYMNAYCVSSKSQGAVTFAMKHRMAMLTATYDFKNEFAQGTVLSKAEVYSTSSTATFDYTQEGIMSVDEESQWVSAYIRDGKFTAIVMPGEYKAGDELMRVTVDGATEPLIVKAKEDFTLGEGEHRAFTLSVGKEYIEADENTTAETLQNAIAAKLAAGETDIRIKLAEDADATMFSAITAALAADGIEEGSIDLTISGAKTVPKYGFFDYDDYSDNDDKNIAGDKLKSLTLTDVETIGKYAFSACTYLESVNLPQVVTIGECAFNEWEKGTKLTSLNLPNATTIGEWAFAYSSLLTSINLPKVTNIGMFAFGYCDLRTLNLPEVTTIDGEAFFNNYNLVSCSAPKATTIDYYPWGNCSKLETLELTAAGGFTLGNNLFANTPTGQINLVLNKDKESQVTQNADGTATWKTTNSNGGILEYTFKSITTQE